MLVAMDEAWKDEYAKRAEQFLGVLKDVLTTAARAGSPEPIRANLDAPPPDTQKMLTYSVAAAELLSTSIGESAGGRVEQEFLTTLKSALDAVSRVTDPSAVQECCRAAAALLQTPLGKMLGNRAYVCLSEAEYEKKNESSEGEARAPARLLP